MAGWTNNCEPVVFNYSDIVYHFFVVPVADANGWAGNCTMVNNGYKLQNGSE